MRIAVIAPSRWDFFDLDFDSEMRSVRQFRR